jgi:tRNA (adenine37-N6)-methyltransferase
LRSVEHLVSPIGWVHSPFVEKVRAPRQSVTSVGAAGRIEVLPRYEHALADLDGFERLWVLFWFDRARHAPSKVLPPRSAVKRGVFATRSPHRPNPIGLSAVRLEQIEGLSLFVRDLDMLDGTPVLDLKPYLPYADAFPDAKTGWLEPGDPVLPWQVAFSEQAELQVRWLEERCDLDLRARICETLALGPAPHPYRRIRRLGDGALVLAVKDWRVRFCVTDRLARVERIWSGYRPRQLALGSDAAIVLHRAFVAEFS